MGTITTEFETGSFELLATTIRAWLSRTWSTTLPATDKTPDFVSPDLRKDKTCWPSKKNKKAVYVNPGRKSRMVGSSDGRTVVMMVEDVRVDLFAPSFTDLDQFMEKINNIITDTQINSSNRITKANDSDVSKIARFREHQIDWNDPFAGETSDKTLYVHTFGYLGCIYQKGKTA